MSNQIQLSEIIKREILNLQYYNLSYEDILSPVMIDRLHCLIEIGEHKPIADTFLLELADTGEVIKETRKSIKLSNSSTNEVSMLIRSKSPTTLELITSPNKYIYGHNLYGSSNITFLLNQCLGKALKDINRPDLLPLTKDAIIELHGVDINSMLTINNVQDYLNLIPSRLDTTMGITQKGNTVYVGDFKQGNIAFRIYDKYVERMDKKLLDELKIPDRNYIFDKLRVELILHKRELEKLSLTNLTEWEDDTPLKIYTTYLDKLKMLTSASEDLRLLTPEEAGYYCRWKLMNDRLDVIIPSKNTRGKYRNSIKDKMGVDIGKPYSATNRSEAKLPTIQSLEKNSFPKDGMDYQLAESFKAIRNRNP